MKDSAEPNIENILKAMTIYHLQETLEKINIKN